jgi:hypothetical protein
VLLHIGHCRRNPVDIVLADPHDIGQRGGTVRPG